MNEQEMESVLNETAAALILAADMNEVPDCCPSEWANVEMVRTFDEAGLLTGNKGIVLTMKDGTEFQISVVQSR
ncbi:MAG: hypothetical protein NTW87_36940 [Planctomycetota bacterium]|nr:hypothetical protein [Planctomycetota bacterium]